MPSPVRAGLTRIGRPTASGGPPTTYQGTTSGYGPTRGDSMGYNPANPHAYSASQAAKAYSPGSRNDVIAPPGLKGAGG